MVLWRLSSWLWNGNFVSKVTLIAYVEVTGVVAQIFTYPVPKTKDQSSALFMDGYSGAQFQKRGTQGLVREEGHMCSQPD